MIIKYNTYNESLRDKIKGKSKEEIYKVLGMSDDINGKYVKHIYPSVKKDIENKFEDVYFFNERTLYNERYYIMDKYDDESNLKEIEKIINEYGIVCTTSTHNGHSTLKITVKR